jgi:hypothetical protein
MNTMPERGEMRFNTADDKISVWDGEKWLVLPTPSEKMAICVAALRKIADLSSGAGWDDDTSAVMALIAQAALADIGK